MAPYLAQLLTDPYSAVRYIAQRSLKRVPGFGSLQYDYLGPDSDRVRVQESVFAKFPEMIKSRIEKGHVLLGANGRWQTNRVASLLERRDNRSVELLE